MVQSKHDGDDGGGGVDAWRDEMPTVYRDPAAELSRHQPMWTLSRLENISTSLVFFKSNSTQRWMHFTALFFIKCLVFTARRCSCCRCYTSAVWLYSTSKRRQWTAPLSTRAFQFGQKSFHSIRFDSRYRIDFFDSIRFGNLIHLPLVH